MKTLFLAWQDPQSRHWLTVGRLTFENNLYKFVYTSGALESQNFSCFARMDDLYSSYVSEELFPLFANRILSKSRPEYNDFIRWLTADNEPKDDVFTMLALTGGVRGTDLLEIFPCPEPDASGNYNINFFCHGLRHLPNESSARVRALPPGEKLFALLDVQNPFDPLALALRTDDPTTLVGYCPRYLAEDFNFYLKHDPDVVKFKVLKVNPDAPEQMRLLCNMTAPWLKHCKPCSNDQYRPLSDKNLNEFGVESSDSSSISK